VLCCGGGGGGGWGGGLFHCFTGDAARARRVLDLGFAVSFAGIVTFPRAQVLREAARVVPLERLLVETDAPYLAPVPHRGRRNEPAWVTAVVESVAAARGERPEQVAEATCRVFQALLRP
jgi:TatD DNase family protein